MFIDPQEIFEYNEKVIMWQRVKENWSRDRKWRLFKALQKLEE